MAEDDDPKPKTTDPDRSAILARRQHFIALALSGLATTACTDGGRSKPGRGSQGDSKGQVAPQPCLKEEIRDEEHEEAPPQPCLNVALPPDPPPQPCLKVAAPEDDEAGESEGGEQAEPKPESKPRPCLRKMTPRPCLRKKAPE
jgi:hypothetical protein